MFLSSFYSKKNKKFFSNMLIFNIIVIINIIFEVIQSLYYLPMQTRMVISNIQIVLFLFVSYKYIIKGFCLTFIITIINSVIIFIQFQKTNEQLLMQIAYFQFITIFMSGLICLLAYRQKKMRDQLNSTPYMDGLTNTFNHFYFHERLDSEFLRAQRLNSNLGLIIMNIDNFKKFNDTFGHRSGDVLLKQIADVLKNAVNAKDIICRYGGDEFVILLPDLKKDEINSVGPEIKTTIDSFFRTHDQAQKTNVSITMGYTVYPDIALTKEELISQSEDALYNAKQSGKNNIRVYKDIFVDIKQYLSLTENQMLISLKTLLKTISAKDRYTLGHSERVMDYALEIGQSLGLSENQLRALKISALLHDIGKIEIPQDILNKRGPLTDEEFKKIRMHPVYSADIVEPISSFGKIDDIIRQHHERYDGKGYPQGLQGEHITLEARILSVADAFDAMLSSRPYRKSFSVEQAVTELKKCSGYQFDTQIVDVFLKLINENKFFDLKGVVS